MNKLIIFLILIGIVILTSSTTIKQDSNVVIENNELEANIVGYMESCINKPTISIYEEGNWREANTQLPGKGMYFLDGEYRGYGMCDVVVCNKIENPIQINLVEYVEIEKKESLETEGYQVPDYSTKILNGKIKVELDYYTDSDCKNKKTYSVTVNN